MERGFLVAGKQRPAGRRRRWAIQEKGAAEGDRIRKRGERRGGGGDVSGLLCVCKGTDFISRDF